MKKIKESGTVAVGGGNFNSDGPQTARKRNKYFSGLGTGRPSKTADNSIGGVMGLGKNFPVDYFDNIEDESDELDEFVNEVLKLKNENIASKAGNILSTTISSLILLNVFIVSES